MKKIIIIAVAVVVVAGAAAYYFLAVRGNDEATEGKIAVASFIPGDYFVTNVRDSSKLFKVTVVLMLDTDKLAEELEKDEFIIRDIVIARLRELTEEDITGDGIQDRLRTELTAKLNSALEIDNIVTIYFSDFVMQ